MSEYVLLIAVVTAALIGMQTYMKRGVQGAVQVAADAIGDQRKGSIEEDYSTRWFNRASNINSTVTGSSNSRIGRQPGRVTYQGNEVTQQNGTAFYGVSYEKE
jgi:Flp pilus assembly pilin Flp